MYVVIQDTVVFARLVFILTCLPTAEGEHIEMGGIIDAEKGALLYRRTTNVKTVETDGDDVFQKKRIIQVTDETGWLGEDETTINQKAIEKPVPEPEKDAGLIEEENPLYSDKDYDVGFNNPMYSKSSSSTAKKVKEPPPQIELPEQADDATPAERTTPTSKLLTPSQRRGRKEAATEADNQYLDYLSSEATVDTYF